MINRTIYDDIAKRADGNIYIGVVGRCKNRKIYLYQALYGCTGFPTDHRFL